MVVVVVETQTTSDDKGNMCMQRAKAMQGPAEAGQVRMQQLRLESGWRGATRFRFESRATG